MVEKERYKVNCEQARKIDLVRYLQEIGFSPVKIRGNDFWYLSPFREERTPSFKVCRKRNRWYDFGEGVGGSLIDFAIRYQQCTIGEFLQALDKEDLSFHRREYTPTAKQDDTRPQTLIQGDSALYAFTLIDYLKRRRIPITIADRYCREVRYAIGDKRYFAIGFPNSSGGWELRNPYFKGSSSPKSYTLLHPGRPILCVFEGFIDFLSFITLVPEAESTYSFLVLNNLSMFEKGLPMLGSYEEVWLFFDNDPPGRNVTLQATAFSPNIKDKSSLYPSAKDLNDWHCQQQFPDST